MMLKQSLTAVLFALAGFLSTGAHASGATGMCFASITVEPGQYSAHAVTRPPSGLMREDGTVIGGRYDSLAAFNLPEHVDADFLWFTTGAMSWNYDFSLPSDAEVQSLTFSAEVSSEASGFADPFPSPLTVSINGMPVGTWTIPGDPGKSRGVQRNALKLGGSQYGWLTHWTIDTEGTYFSADFRDPSRAVSAYLMSGTTIRDVGAGSSITVQLKVPGTRGINLYGDTWGDYPVDPTVMITYSTMDRDGDGLGDSCDPDDDNDGVLDDSDQCPSTPPDSVVNAAGCSVDDFCPCAHPTNGNLWKNHGAYIACVAHTSKQFSASGLITSAQRSDLMSAAASSSCGQK